MASEPPSAPPGPSSASSSQPSSSSVIVDNNDTSGARGSGAASEPLQRSHSQSPLPTIAQLATSEELAAAMCATPPPRALTSSTAPPAHDESVTPSNDDGSGEWVKPTLVRSNSHPAKVRQRKRAHTVGARTALPAVKSARSLLGWPKASTVDPPSQRIVVGVCAMDKKVKAKPMQNVLHRLPQLEFKIIEFGDNVILHKPVAEWPTVDYLIAFYSKGFPLEKAMEYVKLRKPKCVHDLEMEYTLRDRRKFYEVLVKAGVPVPRHVVVDRAPGAPPVELVEAHEYIEVNGVRITKPFVEKPLNAEDHNVYIYYPDRYGGGHKRLFRKVNNRSSEFYPGPCSVRQEGAFIYEEFAMTMGTDIKVYAVGEAYCHAEGRKSPVVDGVVLRDSDGKEVRFPVVLTLKEKDMCRRVVRAFRHTVCGFDLLRTTEGTYVCDVNGFSFVKKSTQYYDDCAKILTRTILKHCAPGRLWHYTRPSIPRPSISGLPSRESSVEEELRCVVAVVRHGDRTPKQKMKMTTTNPELCALIHKYGSNPRKEVKLKAPAQLAEVLEISRRLIAAHYKPRTRDSSPHARSPRLEQVASADNPHRRRARSASDGSHDGTTSTTSAGAGSGAGAGEGGKTTSGWWSSGDESNDEQEQLYKLLQIQDILGGEVFHGINRKVQIKPLAWSRRRKSATSLPTSGSTDSTSSGISMDAAARASLGSPLLLASSKAKRTAAPLSLDSAGASRLSSPGLSRISSGFSIADDGAEQMVVTEALVVLKWGGVLTHSGRDQAAELGERFRNTMYPGDDLELLRLHSTYRHDLKIYSSNEGRVEMTAAAIVKGLLSLDGDLTPILASMVQYRNTAKLLEDPGRQGRKLMQAVKQRLQTGLAAQRDIPEPLASKAKSVMPLPTLDDGLPVFPAVSPAGIAAGTTTAFVATTLSPAQAQEVAAAMPPDLLQDVAQTRSISSIQALTVIGNQPRRTLQRIWQLIGLLLSDLRARGAKMPADKSRGRGRGGSRGRRSSPKSRPAPDRLHVDISVRASASAAKSSDKPASSSSSSTTTTTTTTTKSSSTSAGTSSPPRPALSGASSVPIACHDEDLLIVFQRWRKLYHEFYNPATDNFNLSKIPDIYDCVKYEAIHNGFLDSMHLRELFWRSRACADLIIPQEYGISHGEKRAISDCVLYNLARKISFDMTAALTVKPEWAAPPPAHSPAQHGTATSAEARSPHGAASKKGAALFEDEAITRLDEAALPGYDASWSTSKSNQIRTRIYVTSESHVHTIVNALAESVGAAAASSSDCGPPPQSNDDQIHAVAAHELDELDEEGGADAGRTLLSSGAKTLISATPELDYLTHIVFRVYENPTLRRGDPKRHRVEIMFSPGCNTNPFDVEARRAAEVQPVGLESPPRAAMRVGSGASSGPGGGAGGGAGAGAGAASAGGAGSSTHGRVSPACSDASEATAASGGDAKAAPTSMASSIASSVASSTTAPDASLRGRTLSASSGSTTTVLRPLTGPECDAPQPEVLGNLSHVTYAQPLQTLGTNFEIKDVVAALQSLDCREHREREVGKVTAPPLAPTPARGGGAGAGAGASGGTDAAAGDLGLPPRMRTPQRQWSAGTSTLKLMPYDGTLR